MPPMEALRAGWDATFLPDPHGHRAALCAGLRSLLSPQLPPQQRLVVGHTQTEAWQDSNKFSKTEIFESQSRSDIIWDVFWKFPFTDPKSSRQALCTCKHQQLQQIPTKLSDLYRQSHYISHVAKRLWKGCGTMWSGRGYMTGGCDY